MAALANDVARCTGQQCPSAANCRRYAERILPNGVMVPFAAFYLRREAGASACDGFIPIEPVSTFDAQHAVGRIIHANPAEV